MKLLAVHSTLLLLAVALTACGGGGDKEHPGFRLFKERIADAEAQHYTPYWLGRSFFAGDLTFEGPYVSQYSEVVRDGGVEASYHAFLSDGKGGVSLDLYEYSTAAWQQLGDGWSAEGPDTVVKQVELAGVTTQLQFTEGGTRPVGQLRTILTFDDTVLVVVASSGGSAAPGGSDVNPLVDEGTFRAVVDQIRPYPEQALWPRYPSRSWSMATAGKSSVR